MTRPIGFSSQYDFRGIDIHFSPIKDRLKVKITKESELGQSTLFFDPQKMHINDKLELLNVCVQYEREKTSDLIKKIDKCTKLIHECLQTPPSLSNQSFTQRKSPIIEEIRDIPDVTIEDKTFVTNEMPNKKKGFIDHMISIIKDARNKANKIVSITIGVLLRIVKLAK